MNRYIKTIALAFALTTIVAPANAGLAITPTVCAETASVETARQATVTIRVPGIDGEEEAIGAGFLHAASGKIVTNAHVVGDLETLHIGLFDGRIVSARVLGRDPVTDIAILEADVGTIPGLDFADEPVTVGVTVHAVGTPFGLGQTVTRGIVSALDRPIDATTPFGMIQHDAALNPGSSGGPVINASSKVIGINVAMPDGFRRDVGIAYAIPATVAIEAVEKLVSGVPVVERRIGVILRALTPRLADAVGAEAGSGALVESVQRRSAAEKAGIVASDIIVSVGGHPVAELRDVAVGVEKSDASKPLAVQILRGDEVLSVELPADTLRVAAAPARKPLRGGGRRPVPASELGMTVAPDSPARIASVGKGTPAAAAGIEPGDIVLAVGRTRVESPAEAKRLIGETVGGPFALLVGDSVGGTRYVVVDPWAGGLDGDRLGGNMRNPRSASY